MTSPPAASSDAPERSASRRSRLRLDTRDRVRREAARLYVDGRDGRRDPQQVCQLASALEVVGRLIGADKP